MLTEEQVKLLRRKRMEGKTQEAAAAAAGMSVRSARKWEEGPLPSEIPMNRTWRTRSDPFADVWDDEVVPLLEADKARKLLGTTVFDELVRRHAGRFEPGQVRTLQRHIREWRALNGPERTDVVFQQEHPPGREGAFDFTVCDDLGVTIAGVAFVHLLFVLRLSYSKWTYAELAFGETWEALAQGLQNALWALGGVFAVARHDNLSAATRDLKQGQGRSLTKRFEELLDHYDLESTRINPGESHENGIVEKANDLLKTDLDQALLLRGYRDFDSQAAYAQFVAGIVTSRNERHASDIAVERAALRLLPDRRLPAYTETDVVVKRWSTISVRRRIYSVPSRLMGEKVTARLHADVVEVWFHETLVATMPRLRGSEHVKVDYRHVIWSLVRKPGAFARYRYRDELFPTVVFRRAYDALVGWRGDRADIEYVRILHLAASTMQATVERALTKLLEKGETFDYVSVKAIAHPEPVDVPEVNIGAPDLAQFDRLLRSHA